MEEAILRGRAHVSSKTRGDTERPGPTVLFTTHDIAQAEKADMILVMAQGCLVEQGSHARLLARDGIYARLLRAGTSRAREEKGGGQGDLSAERGGTEGRDEGDGRRQEGEEGRTGREWREEGVSERTAAPELGASQVDNDVEDGGSDSVAGTANLGSGTLQREEP